MNAKTKGLIKLHKHHSYDEEIHILKGKYQFLVKSR